jgi:hypothetical protein
LNSPEHRPAMYFTWLSAVIDSKRSVKHENPPDLILSLLAG